MAILYDFLFLIFAVGYLPFFLLKGKFHRGVWQRLGVTTIPASNASIWIHAVSVGEVAAVRSLWERLKIAFPSYDIVISTVTRTGNELARKMSSGRAMVIYLPLDISFVVESVLRRIRPKALVIAETEIWPSLIHACHKNNVPVALVNGRISDKAFKRYRAASIFLKFILNRIDTFCVQTELDKQKFVSLGAPEAKIKVAGNTKYCNTDYADSKKDYTDFKKKLGIRERETVLVAGSTHRGEEEIILDVFRELCREFDNLRLVIAPRHIDRAAEVKKLSAGSPNISVIDKIGILVDAYSIADIVFVGGSLVKHGGQNIIEPAVFAKPVIFGPHMFNFQSVAAEFLRNKAAIQIRDKQELQEALRRLAADRQERTALGEKARTVVLNNQGAVEGCLAEIRRLL
jgi:3-deoxy-D-manno-octulosonic-acid transferase